MITVVSAVVSSPVITMIASDDDSTGCTFASLHDGLIQAVLIIISVTYVIVFVIICVCYTKVALTIKHKLIQNSSLPNEQNHKNTRASIKNGDGADTSDTRRPFRISIHCKVAPTTAVETNCVAEAPQHSQLSQSSKSYKDVLFDPSVNRTVSTTVETQDQRSGKPEVAKRRIPTSSRVDRTTRIMFSVTMVFLLSWLPTWIVAFYERTVKEPSQIGRIFILFGDETFIVNTFANPIFYICLSSAFKERAITVLRCRIMRQRR